MPFHDPKIFGDLIIVKDGIAMNTTFIEGALPTGPWEKTKPLWKRWCASQGL
jgi:hypothetical protein